MGKRKSGGVEDGDEIAKRVKVSLTISQESAHAPKLTCCSSIRMIMAKVTGTKGLSKHRWMDRLLMRR